MITALYIKKKKKKKKNIKRHSKIFKSAKLQQNIA